jgi:hypothetical protein
MYYRFPPFLFRICLGFRVSDLGFRLLSHPPRPPALDKPLAVVWCLLSGVCCASTLVENPLQIDPFFMQNKPNFRETQMNLSSFFTKDYRNELARAAGRNKPKQTQSNPISNVGKMNATFFTTKPYANEPRTMNYERLPKTNPIKPNFQMDGHNRAQSGK